MRFKQIRPGKWEQPVIKGYRLMCCDCNLVHRMDFRVVNGHVQYRAWRDDMVNKRRRFNPHRDICWHCKKYKVVRVRERNHKGMQWINFCSTACRRTFWRNREFK